MSDLLPLPPHFDADMAASWSYEPNPAALRDAAAEYAGRHGVEPIAENDPSVSLLLIDAQRDFCLRQGALYVAGRSGRAAIEDSRRTCQFLYRNVAQISRVVCTLDTHLPHQIFFASFWRSGSGEPIEAGREVSLQEVERGAIVPRDELASWLCAGDVDWLREQAIDYCRKLESQGRYRLFLWPEHCLLGSSGHALVGAIQEARLFHGYLRAAPSPLVPKGTDPLTENYSVFRPEVAEAANGRALGSRNQELLDDLLDQDLVIVAGQAASHCVRASLEDLLDEIVRRDAALARRIVVLRDCTSSVVVRNPAGEVVADFTDEAERAFARLEAAGIRFGSSTDSVADWL